MAQDTRKPLCAQHSLVSVVAQRVRGFELDDRYHLTLLGTLLLTWIHTCNNVIETLPLAQATLSGLFFLSLSLSLSRAPLQERERRTLAVPGIVK